MCGAVVEEAMVEDDFPPLLPPLLLLPEVELLELVLVELEECVLPLCPPTTQ